MEVMVEAGGLDVEDEPTPYGFRFVGIENSSGFQTAKNAKMVTVIQHRCTAIEVDDVVHAEHLFCVAWPIMVSLCRISLYV
jgi:hypothetical protein